MPYQVTLEGWPLAIFPCRDKKPACLHGFKDAVSDPAEIAALFRAYPGARQIGVATGEINDLDILDVDLRDGGNAFFEENRHRLPQTRLHQTQSGGHHLLFRHAEGLRCSAGKIATGIDVKSTGGYVIWWPAQFYPVQEAPVTDWPAWLLELARQKQQKHRAAFPMDNDGGPDQFCRAMGVEVEPDADPTSTPIPPEPIAYELNYAKRSLANACYELRNCPAGHRNHLLNALAYKMGRLIVRGWVQRGRVEDYLWRACDACGLLADPDDGPAKCRATLASGINAGMREPYHDIRWRVAI
jgi:hypothetical protein